MEKREIQVLPFVTSEKETKEKGFPTNPRDRSKSDREKEGKTREGKNKKGNGGLPNMDTTVNGEETSMEDNRPRCSLFIHEEMK